MGKKLFKADKNYRAELLGLKVELAGGHLFGKVTGAYDFGAGAVIEIEKTNGKSEMLPLDEKFIREIHKDYIVIEPPEYLEAKPE